MKPKVKTIKMTCSACPSQWSGRTIEWKEVCVRYRWGMLGVVVGGRGVLALEHGGEYDAEMSTDEMRELTKDVLDWSEAEAETGI